MGLDRIVYINLERSPERKEMFIEHMSQVDGAMDILERFNAHDGRDYDSQESVVDAAVADGLDFYAVFKSPKYAWVGRGTLACFWSYFSILRTAIDRGETTLVLYDDRPLVQPAVFRNPPRSISELNEVLSILETEPVPFRALQLAWGYEKNRSEHYLKILFYRNILISPLISMDGVIPITFIHQLERNGL